MPPFTAGAAVVFALILLALLLFVTEWLSPDMTAIGILVSLVVLQPFTGVPLDAALAGFASPAVLTILAMYALSEGVRKTGLVERLGAHCVPAAVWAWGVGVRRRIATITTAAVTCMTPRVA